MRAFVRMRELMHALLPERAASASSERANRVGFHANEIDP
jgi:hypothetical protein